MYNLNPLVFCSDSNYVVQVRISDDVLDEEDWGVDELTIKNGVVVSQKKLSNGVYTIPDMVGWTTDKLIEWTQHCNAIGSHPEQYYEIIEWKGGDISGQVV
jgi:hypothetical protein